MVFNSLLIAFDDEIPIHLNNWLVLGYDSVRFLTVFLAYPSEI